MKIINFNNKYINQITLSLFISTIITTLSFILPYFYFLFYPQKDIISPEIRSASISSDGYYGIEKSNEDNRSYQWVSKDSILVFPKADINSLCLNLSGGPGRTANTTLSINSTSFTFQVQPSFHKYCFISTAQQSNKLILALSTDHFYDHHSNRDLGIVVGSIEISHTLIISFYDILIQFFLTILLFLFFHALIPKKPIKTIYSLSIVIFASHTYINTYNSSIFEHSSLLQIIPVCMLAILLLCYAILQTHITQQFSFSYGINLSAQKAAIIALWTAPFIYLWIYIISGASIFPYDILSITEPWRTEKATIQNPMLSDVIRQYLPWRELYARALLGGELPFWNHYTFSGMPFLANLQSMVLYPFNLIFLLPRIDLALTLFLLIHLLVSGFGMYCLMRMFNRHPIGALCAALVWMFCGFATVWRPWLSITATLAWLPWLLVGCNWCVTRPGKRAFGATTLVAVLLLLSGHIQFAYYEFLFAGIFVLWRVISLPIKWKQRAGRLIIPLGGVLLGACASAVQLIPTFELSHFGSRGSTPIRDLIALAIPLPHIVTLLFPYWFGGAANYHGAGNFVEFTGYIGISCLALLLMLFTQRNLGWRSGFWFFAASALIGIHLAYGGALNQVAAYLPLYTSFRGLQRLYGIWSFGAAACVAWAVDGLIYPRRGQALVILWAAVLSIIGLLCGCDPQQIHLWLERIGVSLSVVQLRTLAVVLAGLGLGMLAMRSPWPKLRGIGLMAIPVVIFFDLFSFSWGYYPADLQPRGFAETPGIRYLQAHAQDGRLSKIGPGMLESPMMPNTSIMFGLDDIDGYDSFTLDRYNQMLGVIELERYNYVKKFNVIGNFHDPKALASPVLNLLGTAFTLSAKPLAPNTLPPSWKPVYEGADMSIYQNNHALPMGFIVGDARVMSDDANMLEALGDRQFNPAQVALLEQPPTGELDKAGQGTANLTQRTFNSLAFTAHVDTAPGKGALLIIRQNFYPGWQAWVDGVPTPILRTDYTFQSILLDSGDHTVVLQFTPTGFWPLLVLMGIIVLTSLGLLLWPNRDWVRLQWTRVRAWPFGAACTWAIAAALGLRLIRFASDYAVNLIFSDQWDFYNPLFHGEGWLGMMLYKHGPHRQGLGGLLLGIGATLSGWDFRVDSYIVVGVVVLAVPAALALVRRLHGPLRISDALIPLIILTTASFESLTVIPNPAHSAVPMLLGILVALAWTVPDARWRYGLLSLLSLALVFTGFGLFMGLLIPTLLAVEAAHHLVRRSAAWRGPALGLLASAASWALFFVRYQFDSASPCPIYPPSSPLSYIEFIALMFARFVGIDYGRAPVLALWVGGALLVGAVGLGAWAGVRVVRVGPQAAPTDRAGALLIAYSLLFSANSAVGRVCSGVDGGQASRYMLLMIPAFLGAYLLLRGLPFPRRRAIILAVLVLLLLPLPLPYRSDDEAAARGFAQYKQTWRACYLKKHDVSACDKKAGIPIYPAVAPILPKLAFLEENGLNLFHK